MGNKGNGKENYIWLDTVGVYYENLFNLNKNLLKLCNSDAFEMYEIQDLIKNISIGINLLIPYKIDNETSTIQLINDGIIVANKKINIIKPTLKNILINNYEFLKCFREIRNKATHSPHLIRISSTGSGSRSLPDVKFKIVKNDYFFKTAEEINNPINKDNNKEYHVKTESIVDIVISLNSLFDEITREIEKMVFVDDTLADSLYIKK